MTSNSTKGMLVGFANTCVIAVCIAAMSTSHHARFEVFVLVTMFGSIPGVLTGALLGYIAGAATKAHRGVLLATMILVSALAVATLGSMFGVEDLIVVSCIPTAAACSVLERWTRPVPDPLPPARV